MKGRTKWFPSKIKPVRNGEYECIVLFARTPFRWTLQWDGTGFIAPFPMCVVHWRGLTKAEYFKESK